ncbi:MAG: hypothetical protein IKB02_01455 [Clostridia bacterium]|nr:hypothetical protein [Clostridia bacterium]
MKQNVIFKTTREMNEKREKPEYIRIANHNPCPCCGGDVYGVVSPEGIYHVECIECAYRRDASTPFSSVEPSSAILEMRLDWNRGFLLSSFSSDALDAMGLEEGDYLAVDPAEDIVLLVARSTEEIWEHFLGYMEDVYFNIYVVKDGTLVEVYKIT